METTSVRNRVAAMMICLGIVSCGFDKMVEDCGSEADALAAAGLLDSTGADFNVAGLTMPLPHGYMYRIRGDVLDLFEAPGIYCDSGDWGVVQDGFVQLQVHEDLVPADAFRYFPDTHRGYMREQIDYAPVSPLSYSFDQNALRWHVQAYLSGVYHPRVRLMYLRTEIPNNGRQIGLSIHYFPHDSGTVMYEVSSAIDRIVREARRANQ